LAPGSGVSVPRGVRGAAGMAERAPFGRSVRRALTTSPPLGARPTTASKSSCCGCNTATIPTPWPAVSGKG
jgi:hypothetical protein